MKPCKQLISAPARFPGLQMSLMISPQWHVAMAGKSHFNPQNLPCFKPPEAFSGKIFSRKFHLSNIFNLLFWARIFTNNVSLVAKDLPLKHGQGQLTSVALNATWAQPGIHLGPEVVNSDLIKLWHGLIIQTIYEEFTLKKLTDVMYTRNPVRL